MFASEQMRFGAQIMAAMFGGPGIFYVWKSFSSPNDAVTAVMYLIIATALALAAESKTAPAAPRPGASRRRKTLLALLWPRR